ncbi:uridine kinase family protein [Streptomyces sp. GSL17-111]|uniref:uridine kinase family protein n=1 Tax=Streptomyces sp. GSL17-111 TaxID=3121596 RepID=UPI0030F4A418
MTPPSPAPDALAARLRTLPASCGAVRLVAVDGHAGSGKSTLARILAAALGDAPVLHLDDLASHASFFGWTARLADEVLTPLARGATARPAAYDWERRAFGRPLVLPPAPVVLLEGVGAGRRAVRPALAAVLWLDVDREVAWERGRRRDGPALAAFWDAWTAAEQAHFAADPTRPYADLLVRQVPRGYAVLPGPQARRLHDERHPE